jgi:large repetitive protein
MKNKRRNRYPLILSLIVGIVLTIPAVALADIVINDVVVTGVARNDTIAAGASTTINYHIKNQNVAAGDTQNSCNPADSTPATVTINAPAGVTATPAQLTFGACEAPKAVQFSSNKAGDYNITVSVSDAGGGRYDTSGAAFTLHVTAPQAPQDTTPPQLVLPQDMVMDAVNDRGAIANYAASATDAVDGPVAVNCSPPSDSAFPIGTTTVNCSATDKAGNKASGSFTVTVRDTTAPRLTLPEDKAIEAVNDRGVIANYVASATDAVDGTVAVDCSPPSDSAFPIGTTTVSCSAADKAGNKASGSFKVTVQDTVAPRLTLPEDKVLEATNDQGAIANYAASAIDTVDGSVRVDCLPASDSVFPVGTTTVNCSATDRAGNKASGSFTVKVLDSAPPRLTLPEDKVMEAVNDRGAIANYVVVATDAVDGTVAVDCSPPSDSAFPIGTTTVNCSAVDKAGNKASGSFTVTVRDTTAPRLTLPQDEVVEAVNDQGALVNYAASANDAVDGSVSVDCSPESGSTFALGNTTVNCSASDEAGNKADGSFAVKVQDTTAPRLTLPEDKDVEATSADGAAVEYMTSASDAVDGSVQVDCSPQSGSTFPIGTTTVDCTATDKAGNKANGSFAVKVQDTTAPQLTLPQDKVIEAATADGTVVEYMTSATDAVDGEVVVRCSPESGSTFALGNTTVDCSATDKAGNKSDGSFTVKVQDTIAPRLTLPEDKDVEATSADGAAVEYMTSASDAVDGSVQVDCSPQSGSTFPIGTTTVACTATDKAGNKADGSFSVKVQDTTPPTNITFVGNIDEGSAFNFGDVPAQPICKASDSASGMKSCVVSGHSTTVGTHKLTATATDNAGNTAKKELSYTVRPWDLKGFYQPVDMNVHNGAKAGSTVPMKFEVFKGTTELTDPGVAKTSTQKINCTTLSGTEDAIEAYVTGGTSLRYDATGGQFIFNWQTPKAPGACYKVTVTPQDGTPLSANFKLK